MYALLRLHAALGDKVLRNKQEADGLAQSMLHVEAVLKMLQPGYDVRPISMKRRQSNPWFKRGTIFRTAMDVLRTAGTPMTPGEIAKTMLIAKGVEPSRRVLQGIRTAVQASLKNHQRGGLVIAHECTNPVRWSLR